MCSWAVYACMPALTLEGTWVGMPVLGLTSVNKVASTVQARYHCKHTAFLFERCA